MPVPIGMGRAFLPVIKATVQVVKRNQLHVFVVLPKHWIVE
jgi:hypothetical protein